MGTGCNCSNSVEVCCPTQEQINGLLNLNQLSCTDTDYEFSVSPTPAEVGTITTFQNTLGITCDWDFGDGTQDNGVSVTHSYSEGGTSTVICSDPLNSSRYCEMTIGIYCPTPTATPTVTLTPVPTVTSPPVTTVTPTPVVTAWFQTKEGDVHGNDGVSSNVPAGQVFSQDGEVGGYPGVISSGDSTISVGDVSSTDWHVENEEIPNFGGRTYDYTYFYQLLGSPVPNFDGDLSKITANGVYYSANTVTINSDWSFPSARWAIILVGDKLEVRGKITVPVGSFLAFIVKKEINISGTVGEPVGLPGADLPDLEGVYLADGAINTNYDNDNSGNRFVGAGTFVSKTRFDLGRDLGINNDTTPAEYFSFRPDFWFSAPEAIQRPNYNWQEIAP